MRPPACSRSAAGWRCCAPPTTRSPCSRELPVDLTPSPALWEIKCVGLILIFIYAFFKFAWSYRLFNYVAILLGAMPPATERDTAAAEAHVMRTTRLFEAAGRHFNRGQRAFFFALGYLGWFVSPWVLLRDHRARRDRDLAAAVRIERVASDGDTRTLKNPAA